MKVTTHYRVTPGNITEHQVVAVVTVDTEKGPHEAADGDETSLCLTPSQLRALAAHFTKAAHAIDKMHEALNKVMVPDWTRER